jgi:hypothetical protein
MITTDGTQITSIATVSEGALMSVHEVWRSTSAAFDVSDWEVAATDDTTALVVADGLEDYRDRNDATIAAMPSQILLSVSSTYARQTELADFEASMSAELAVRDSEIELNFRQVATATSKVAEDLAADMAERAGYFRFDATGMEIGREGSDMRTRIDNVHVGFLQGESEVAAIYNDHLYVPAIEVASSVAMGTPGVGYIDQIIGADGSWALKKRSG